MKERLARWLTSLSAKYIALFALLVGVPVVATSVYLLYSSYQDNKRALIRLQQEKAKSVAVTIDQFLTDLTDNIRSVNARYVSLPALGAVLKPLLGSNATTAFYVDVGSGGGLDVGADVEQRPALGVGVLFPHVAGSHPLQRLVAVEVVTAGKVHSEAGPQVPLGPDGRIHGLLVPRVAHRQRHVDGHPADRVDDAAEALEVDLDVVMDGNAEVLRDRVGNLLRARTKSSIDPRRSRETVDLHA